MARPLTYRWVKTCCACPEQYDVFDGDQLVAYVRMRFGRLTASVTPDAQPFYSVDFDDEPYKGSLDTNERREHQAAIEQCLRATAGGS